MSTCFTWLQWKRKNDYSGTAQFSYFRQSMWKKKDINIETAELHTVTNTYTVLHNAPSLHTQLPANLKADSGTSLFTSFVYI